MIKVLITIVFGCIALLAFACAGSQNNTNVATDNGNAVRANASAATPLPAATIDELASGREVYATNCAKCHKENGTGGKVTIEGKEIKADDLTSNETKRFPDEKIIRIIMNGAEDDGMPAFKGKLSEGEMRDVVKFIRVELQKMPDPTSAPKGQS
jgi:mono/diheme cytochrome c family protein